MSCTGLVIGGTSAQDNIGIQFESSSETVGSNSENDKYANHFLQGVQKADAATLRIFDLVAAKVYASYRGSIKSFSCYIPKAAEGSATTGFTISATTSGGALVQEVSINVSKDKEGEAEIRLVFRSSGGTSSGMSVTSLRSPV